MLERAEKAFDAVLAGIGVAVAAIVVVFCLSMCLDWAIKTAGYRGIPWLREVIEYLLYTGVILGAPWALRQGAHVRVDLVLTMLPPRGTRFLERALDAVGLLLCLALGWLGFQLALQLFAENSIVRKTITVQRWIFQAILVASMLLCVLEYAFRLLRRRAA